MKTIETNALFSTLRGIARGEAAVSRVLAAKLLDEFARQTRHLALVLPGADLSPRERTVLELIGQGKTNKEIAATLALAENTVKSYTKNIFEKLHLANRVQAAVFATREGLLERPGGKTA
jgi:DNA-binding NarL/FixJ family response regulator